MFTTEDGLPNDVIMTVMAAHDGSIWTGTNCGGLVRFDGTHFQTYNEKDGLLNSCVMALAEDLNRDLWIATWGGGLFLYHNGTFTEYTKRQGMADDRVTSIVVARDGSVWFGRATAANPAEGMGNFVPLRRMTDFQPIPSPEYLKIDLEIFGSEADRTRSAGG